MGRARYPGRESRGRGHVRITNSAEQAALARERIARAGLADRATVLLQDYRATTGRFDAVGQRRDGRSGRHELLARLHPDHQSRPRPGSRAGLQAILQADDLMRATANTYTWIRKYIFPGGSAHVGGGPARRLPATLACTCSTAIPLASTTPRPLRRWRANFEARSADIARLGFDETFRRMWSFYLAYSESGIPYRMPRRQPDLPSEAGSRSPRIIPSPSAVPPR